MTDNLKAWLQAEADKIGYSTMRRVPNMLPDDQDVAQFIEILIKNVGNTREEQLSAVQFWALTAIGHDAPAARDWLTILRVLKEEIVAHLDKNFPAETVLNSWRLLDDVLTIALIEATQLASDMDRADLLEHAARIRNQMERLDETKTNFIAVAAHELKTPLTILEGYTNMLRFETEPDSRLRIYIDGLENGTSRMNEIVSDIIDVSMIDSQTFELNWQRFYLEKIVLMVADRLDKHFQDRNVDLIIKPLVVERQTYGDPERLVKALTKIVSNALKYTPDGGVVTINSVITQEFEGSDEIGGFVDVQVIDTGIGINAEDLETIFEKFTSATDAALHSSGKIKFKGGGPGLGLPIAKGIIEAHGGRIWAESAGYSEEVFSGSTFHIELPIWLKKPASASDTLFMG